MYEHVYAQERATNQAHTDRYDPRDDRESFEKYFSCFVVPFHCLFGVCEFRGVQQTKPNIRIVMKLKREQASKQPREGERKREKKTGD